MSVVISLDDTIAVFLDAEGSVDLTGVVRLSYAGAVLLFGFLADIRGRAYLPFLTACVLAGSTLMFAFLDGPEAYPVNAVLLYILSASSVVYLTVAFLELAPGTAHPELWAGMGARAALVFGGGDGGALHPAVRRGGPCGDDVRGHSGDGGGAGALFRRRPALARARGKAGPGPGRGQARPLRREIRPHARETDVLAAALFNDKAPKEIAYDLQISERIVQRYSIPSTRRRAQQGRVGLTLLYSGYTPEPPSGPK